MQSYFSEMYQFICKIIDNKDIITRIDIENTANNYRQFQNIVINVQIPHNKCLRFLMSDKKPTEDEQCEIDKIRDASHIFYHNRYKWECYCWRDLVVTLESMYHDLLHTLNLNEIKIPLYYNIMGHNNYDNIWDDNFYHAQKDAAEMDIKEYLKQNTDLMIDEKMTIASIINNLKKYEDKLYWVQRQQDKIERVIKNQKTAYVLSKLIDNKAAREDYKDNHELVEAYDAYIDVKKCLSGNKYN